MILERFFNGCLLGYSHKSFGVGIGDRRILFGVEHAVEVLSGSEYGVPWVEKSGWREIFPGMEIRDFSAGSSCRGHGCETGSKLERVVPIDDGIFFSLLLFSAGHGLGRSEKFLDRDQW